jgi:16S rRNA G966 N2-methylase RsmD
MFDKQQQFFPTPDYVAEKMWSAAKRSRHYQELYYFERVCDTSAGSGSLLKYCRKACRDRAEWCAIEIDPDLRCILKEHDFRVIGTDFLLYEEMTRFDLILINPPFNRGAEHILKSWDMVEDGGCLVALCNSQTIRNPDKKWSRLGELIESHGYVEDLGQCFKEADRPCDVEVSMIFLDKPERVINPETFRFSGEFTQSVDDVKAAAFGENPLAHVDVIDNLLAQYRSCLSILKARHQAQSELLFHLRTIPGRTEHFSDGRKSVLSINMGSLTEQVWELKEQFWNAVFQLSRMKEIQTSHFEGIFRDFVKSQRDMEFSRTNILEILAAFFSNKEQIMLDSLVSVFDRATAFHPENKVHLEGWKTNTGWKVNQRIIVPYGMHWDRIFNHFAGTSDSSEAGCFVKDLDSVCCWITGVDPNSRGYTTIGEMMNRMRDRSPGVWHELKYFRIKWFKKGTLWIEWTDQYLLDDFNLLAATEKKWIGGEGF